MTVLFLLENSPDYPAGGTDLSSHHLASLLRKKGVRVVEWAPYQIRQSPFKYTSLFFLPFLILKTLVTAKRRNVDLVHVQGKYLIPIGVIAAKILRVPIVVTIRDYFIFCPIGLCLFDEQKRHNLSHFLTKEVSAFLQTYHRSDNLIIRIIRRGLLLRGWFVSVWIRWYVRKAGAVIAVSEYVASVLKKFDIDADVIYNCFDVSKYRNIMKSDSMDSVPSRKDIVFVGKDSFGKGSDLFDALSRKEEFSKYRFIKLTTDRWTPYEQVLLAMRDALVTVVPSRWQEPFGRVALESLMMGTPAVVTKRGGLKEIVEDGKYGTHADPSIRSLTKALHMSIKMNQQLRQAIQRDQRLITRKFSILPVLQHLELYQGLLDKIGTR